MKAEDYTLIRQINKAKHHSQDTWLWKCNLCGEQSVGQIGWIKNPNSVCGCVSGRRTARIRYGDFALQSLDADTLQEFKAVVDSKRNENLSLIYDLLYIQKRPITQELADANFMPLASLFRYRRNIIALWFHCQEVGYAQAIEEAHQPKHVTRQKRETLCWDCQNAISGCSWARNFTPVEGWTAVPTEIEPFGTSTKPTKSFCVLNCPLFIKDEKRGGDEE